jgi:hypothetical protein
MSVDCTPLISFCLESCLKTDSYRCLTKELLTMSLLIAQLLVLYTQLQQGSMGMSQIANGNAHQLRRGQLKAGAAPTVSPEVMLHRGFCSIPAADLSNEGEGRPYL